MINDSNIHIFPKTYKLDYIDSVDQWMPTIQEVKEVEPIIENYLDQLMEKPKNDREKELSSFLKKNKLESYYRQYVGLMNEERDSIVWIIFICEKSIKNYPDWKERISIPRGGGACYFNLKLNIKDKKIESISINGPK